MRGSVLLELHFFVRRGHFEPPANRSLTVAAVGRTVLPSARGAGAFFDTRADRKTVRPTTVRERFAESLKWSRRTKK